MCQKQLSDYKKLLEEQKMRIIQEKTDNTEPSVTDNAPIIAENSSSNTVMKAQTIVLPHTPENISAILSATKISNAIVGHNVTGLLKSVGVEVVESENAENFQKSLYDRAYTIYESLGLGKNVKTLVYLLTTGYTLYNLIRYRQMPFGGFIKGLAGVLGDSAGGSLSGTGGEVTSAITVNPNNNITINIPGIETIKETAKATTASMVQSVNKLELSPSVVAALGVLSWAAYKSLELYLKFKSKRF